MCALHFYNPPIPPARSLREISPASFLGTGPFEICYARLFLRAEAGIQGFRSRGGVLRNDRRRLGASNESPDATRE